MARRVRGATVVSDMGDNGKIYEDPLHPNRVIKELKASSGAEAMRREIGIQKKLKGIAPTVYEEDTENSKHMLYSMDFLRPISTWDAATFDGLERSMRSMLVEHHLLHNDMHQGNLMRKGKNGVVLIDFGETREVPPSALRDPQVVQLLMVAQLLVLVDKCSKYNTQCPSTCVGAKCTKQTPFVARVLKWCRDALRAARVPASFRTWNACGKYVQSRFAHLPAYVRLQIFMGLVIHTFLVGCFQDEDDAVCGTPAADWTYAIRSMHPDDAVQYWALVLKGEPPPEGA